MTSELFIYENPSNYKNLLEELKAYKDPDDLLINIKRMYPNWICNIFSNYSDDYPHLNNNWKLICNRFKVNPYKIITVEHIYFDIIDKYPQYDYKFEFLKEACDILVSKGFVIRRKEELIPCRICSKAVPPKRLYDFLYEKNLSCPSEWSDVCKNCEEN